MDHQKEAAACAACNHMRRKCPPNCIFAPYFPVSSPSFDYINQVYSCSNVGKILQSVPVERRRRKAESLAFEAEARIRDPELGCVGYIYLLQQHLAQIDRDIQEAEAQFIAAGYQPPPLPPPPEQQYWHQMPQLTTMTAPPYHEQPDYFPLLTGAATYPSMPQAEPIPQMPPSMSEMLPIPSTTPQQDGQLGITFAEFEDLLGEIPSTQDDPMTDTEIQAFADLKEELLSEIPSTQVDLMTDAEVQDFAADLEEDLLSS